MKRWEEDERKGLPDEGRQESKADNVVRSGNGGYAVMSTKTLYIRMFGGFTIHYGDKAVALNKADSSKSVRLLQMLFLSPEGEISKNELIDHLYGWNENTDLTNRNKNLNNLIYRLKKQLIACGLPEEEYIELSEGMCCFKSSFPMEVDTLKFEKMVADAQESEGVKRYCLLRRANELYCAELLPANLSNGWFFQKSNYFKELYLNTVRELEQIYIQKADYKNRLLLYSRAAAIYPFDNWQTKQIRCNLEIYRYEEALDIYHRTLELYAREIGSPPVEEMQECFEKANPSDWHDWKDGDETVDQDARIRKGWNDMDKAFAGKKNEIGKALLGEDDPDGAYYCTYPGFVDYCRLVERIGRRSGFDAVLMFLTLSGRGRRNFHQNDFGEQMQILKSAISDSLRKGDAYTRYGNRHFILMLVKAGKESCSAIFRRIEAAYTGRAGKGELWYLADMTRELRKSV